MYQLRVLKLSSFFSETNPTRKVVVTFIVSENQPNNHNRLRFDTKKMGLFFKVKVHKQISVHIKKLL